MGIRLNWGDYMRGTGLTKAMVMALPAGGACVVVHCAAMAHYVKQMIRDLRGPDVLKQTNVIVVSRIGDTHKLCGLIVPTFVDHAFWSFAVDGLSREVDDMVRGINVRFPVVA